ncbi:UDP-glucose 4-epimerase [compost metagenome]
MLDLIHTFEEVTGVIVPYEIVNRREGDIIVSIADVCKAESQLGWKAKYTLTDMCVDSWRWHLLNKGY